MANEKKITLTWAESGITIYCLVRRDADDYLLNDADGSFAAAPADKYLSMPEDAVITGLYEVSESRTVWNNGLYLALLYKQVGGSPDLANDTLIASGEMYIWSDVEVDIRLSTISGIVYATDMATVSSNVIYNEFFKTLIRGDSIILPFMLGVNYTGWIPYFGIKKTLEDTEYALEPKELTWVDATTGSALIPLSTTETDLIGEYVGEVELRYTDSKVTALRYHFNFVQDAVV